MKTTTITTAEREEEQEVNNKRSDNKRKITKTRKIKNYKNIIKKRIRTKQEQIQHQENNQNK